MKVIPSAPSTSLTFTEQQVFDLFRRTEWEPGAVALSSVNLSEHEYKRWGELDFVVVSRAGVFALEVKGGSVSCHGGKWQYTTSRGTITRHESPYAQVMGAFFGLESHLCKPGNGLPCSSKLRGGSGVIMAAMRAKDLNGIVGGPEMPAAITGTAEDIEGPTAFRKYLGRLAAYWHERTPGGARPLAPSDVKALVQYMRPDFDRAVPLTLRMKVAREERVQFTEEQYQIFDFLDDEPRLLVMGGAGCGKTFLGVESARREHAAGRNVALVTGTETLAGFLRREGSLPSGIAIMGAAEAMGSSGAAGKFDVVVVDEGQQVTNRAMVGALDHLVKGGVEGGRWRWLADYAHQVALDSDVDNGTLELLKLCSRHQHLFQNCRNTPEVIKAAELISGVKIGRALVRGRGPELTWCTAHKRADVPGEAGAQLERWLSADVASESITLLHAGEDGRKEALATARLAGVAAQPWADAYRGQPMTGSMPHAGILDFRGLESEYVVAFGLEDVADARELRALCYIAITRANFGAALAGTNAFRKRLLELSIPLPLP